MTAYAIFIRESEIKDATAMETYSSMNREAPPFSGLTPLAVYGAMEVLEGAAPDGVVLLEFPDKAAALEWYNSPNYQAALPHRLQGADYRAFIVEGLPGDGKV